MQFEVGDYVCKRDGTVSRVAEQSTWNWAVTESARKVRKASPSLTTLLSPTRGARLYAERQAAAHAASTKKAAEAASASAADAASKSAADAASKSAAQAASASDTMNRSILADLQRQLDEQRRQLDEERRTNERLKREKLDATAAKDKSSEAPAVTAMDVDVELAACREIMRERALARQQQGPPQLPPGQQQQQ